MGSNPTPSAQVISRDIEDTPEPASWSRPPATTASPSGPFVLPHGELWLCRREGSKRKVPFMSLHFPEFRTRRAYPLGRQGTARPAIDWRAIRKADRACCCPARPVVVAVMPSAPGRDHPTDLLLCRHHYRVSQPALSAAGAAIFDDRGRSPVTPPATALTRAN